MWLFEVCERETGYKGVGRRREAWWRQEAKEKQLWATLEILQEAKRRRSVRENVIHQEQEGRGRAGWEIGILGQGQDTPRLENDLVWQAEILGWRRGTPRWADELVW